MLLVCPSCRTRYVVPDTAIGADGRQVRCANCKHSWFQGGAIPPVAPAPPVAAPVFREEVAPPSTQSQPTPVAEAVVPPPAPAYAETTEPTAYRSFGEREPQAPPIRQSVPVFAEPPPPPPPPPVVTFSDELPPQSRFAHEPPFKPRRNPAKLWTMAAVAFALLIGAAGGAFWYFGIPSTGFGLAAQEPDLKIVLNENLELNEREDGTPYFIASGSIVNPTPATQNIPEMLVTLKDSGGRPVYSWKMRAKVSSLAPGARVDFSEARLDVPLAATQISIGWVLGGG
ncbi:MAG: MJ0042-type zinc finger domain-containing protein [Sphingorhabdus sp.]